jgi:hypothetical protein
MGPDTRFTVLAKLNSWSTDLAVRKLLANKNMNMEAEESILLGAIM